MLEQSDSSGVLNGIDHVAEDCSDGIESLVGLADVGQAHVVEENLLDNEDGNGLAEL